MKCPFCEEIVVKPSKLEQIEGVCRACQKKIREIDNAPRFTVPVRSDVPPEARMHLECSSTGSVFTTIEIDYKAAKRCK
jgi:hypothetical protein